MNRGRRRSQFASTAPQEENHWNMKCYFFSVALLLGLVFDLHAQHQEDPPVPIVTLQLPVGMPSEAVQIKYHLVGPFGGLGQFVKPEENRTAYVIFRPEGKASTTNIKIIAYLPGCEVVTMDLAVGSEPLQRPIPCKPLPWVALHGQVLPLSITQDQPVQVEVSYLALWGNPFFGIMDGFIQTFRLGSVRPGKEGKFELKIPDFYKQSALGDGELGFILRNPTTGNIVAMLEPEELSPRSPWLKIQSVYPSLLRLMPWRCRNNGPESCTPQAGRTGTEPPSQSMTAASLTELKNPRKPRAVNP